MGASSWAFRDLIEELAPMGRSYGGNLLVALSGEPEAEPPRAMGPSA